MCYSDYNMTYIDRIEGYNDEHNGDIQTGIFILIMNINYKALKYIQYLENNLHFLLQKLIYVIINRLNVHL